MYTPILVCMCCVSLVYVCVGGCIVCVCSFVFCCTCELVRGPKRDDARADGRKKRRLRKVVAVTAEVVGNDPHTYTNRVSTA